MNLHSRIKEENIFFADTFENTDDFYHEFSQHLKQNSLINDADKVKRLFIKRENVQSTAIGKSAAAPHIFSDEFSDFIVSLAIIKRRGIVAKICL